MATNDVKYVCSECGSENIQVKMWVNPNADPLFNDEPQEWVDDDDCECWCQDCQEITKYKLIEQ